MDATTWRQIVGLRPDFNFNPSLRPDSRVFANNPKNASRVYDRLHVEHNGSTIMLSGEVLNSVPDLPEAGIEETSPSFFKRGDIKDCIHVPALHKIDELPSDHEFTEHTWRNPDTFPIIYLDWRHPLFSVASRLGRLESGKGRVLVEKDQGLTKFLGHDVFTITSEAGNTYHFVVTTDNGGQAILWDGTFVNNLPIDPHQTKLVAFDRSGKPFFRYISRYIDTKRFEFKTDQHGNTSKPMEFLVSIETWPTEPPQAPRPLLLEKFGIEG